MGPILRNSWTADPLSEDAMVKQEQPAKPSKCFAAGEASITARSNQARFNVKKNEINSVFIVGQINRNNCETTQVKK